MEEIKEYYSLEGIISTTRSFLRYLRKKWWLLVLAILFGAGLGAVYYFIQKPKYEAVTTFILEDKSGGGGLAGLASQFGFNVGSLTSGGSLFSGDNILTILKSKKVVQQVLLSPITDSGSGSKTLGDLYLYFTGTKKNWQQKPLLANFSFDNANEPLSPLQDSVLNVIYEAIVNNYLLTERTSKQGSIIKVQVTAVNPLFARLMTEQLVDEASKLYMNLRIGTAQENIRQLQRRSDSLLFLLNNKSYTAAASQPLDINPGIKTSIVPVEIANRDKAVLATLYGEVTKNLEVSKVLLSQQTPVIQLLDRPGVLLNDNKKGLAFLILIGSVISAFIYVSSKLLVFLLVKMHRK